MAHHQSGWWVCALKGSTHPITSRVASARNLPMTLIFPHELMFLMLGVSAVAGLTLLFLSIDERRVFAILYSVLQAGAPLSVLLAFFGAWGGVALYLLADSTLAASVVTFFLFARGRRNALSVFTGIVSLACYSFGVFLLHNLP